MFDTEFLTGIGLNEAQADAVMEAHNETVSYFQGELDKAKADAEEVARLREEIAQYPSAGYWEEETKRIQGEFAVLKAEEESKAEFEKRAGGYYSLLREAGVNAKAADLIVSAKHHAINDVILDGDMVVNAEAVKNSIRSQWGEFIGGTATGPKIALVR